MQSFPANIYSVASVRELDRIAIADLGIPGYTLMQRAAAAALRTALDRFPDSCRWQIICGGGNNGGDGYVLARLAATEGISVSVLALVDPKNLAGDAATAHSDFLEAGGTIARWGGSLDAKADFLVDAMLGSGLDRDVSGDFAAAVTAINQHSAPVYALDIPSGIHGDSGQVMGYAVEAGLTTSFVGLKPGLFLGSGPNYCGDVTFEGLDIDPRAGEKLEPVFRRITSDLSRKWLPARRKGAHKGDFGHVLVVGGGPGMAGAARLCGEAALRSGAGRVSVATHPDHATTIAANCPELMTRALAGADDLEAILESADVIAFGPGLGQSEWARDIFTVVAAADHAAIWDADALNLLAGNPSISTQRIITPHPGEAATLLSTSSNDVQANRVVALKNLQSSYGGVAVLKGAGTLVSSGSGAPWVSTAGNPGMAAAGMGDVLSGVIAGLLAQGLPTELAAAIGVDVHAKAGDKAAHGGQRGLMASDVIHALRSIVNP